MIYSFSQYGSVYSVMRFRMSFRKMSPNKSAEIISRSYPDLNRADLIAKPYKQVQIDYLILLYTSLSTNVQCI